MAYKKKTQPKSAGKGRKKPKSKKSKGKPSGK